MLRLGDGVLDHDPTLGLVVPRVGAVDPQRDLWPRRKRTRPPPPAATPRNGPGRRTRVRPAGHGDRVKAPSEPAEDLAVPINDTYHLGDRKPLAEHPPLLPFFNHAHKRACHAFRGPLDAD